LVVVVVAVALPEPPLPGNTILILSLLRGKISNHRPEQATQTKTSATCANPKNELEYHKNDNHFHFVPFRPKTLEVAKLLWSLLVVFLLGFPAGRLENGKFNLVSAKAWNQEPAGCKQYRSISRPADFESQKILLGQDLIDQNSH
jgi:hypothetical protein